MADSYSNESYEKRERVPERRSSSALPWLLFVFTLLLAGAAGYFGLEFYREKAEELARARTANDDLATRIRTLEQEREALTARLNQVETQAADLSATADSLQADLAEKEAQIKELQSTYDELDKKMKAEITSGDIKLTQSGGRIQVDLIDKILFDSGNAELSSRGQEVLSRLGASLATIKGKQIQVSGHTDDSPIKDKELLAKYATNWELSVSRAVNVVRFLSETARVPPARLLATGHGEHRPIATNATPQGRARNRRIEILLVPQVDAQKTQLAGAPAKSGSVVNAKGSTAKKGSVVPAKKK